MNVFLETYKNRYEDEICKRLDILEQYHPRYHQLDEVTYAGDVLKLVNDEWEDPEAYQRFLKGFNYTELELYLNMADVCTEAIFELDKCIFDIAEYSTKNPLS